MTNQELTERYIYAVVRLLPAKSRDDISAELRSIISDMLEQRCGDAAPSEHDLRVVLAELGSPSELAEKYSPDKNNSLISGIYFTKYKYIMRIVLIAVAASVAGGSVLSSVLESRQIFAAMGDFFYSTATALLNSFAIVTLVFAFLQYKNVSLTGFDSIESLPPVPQRSETIKVSDSVVSIVISLIFTVIFLFFPNLLCICHLNDSSFIPFFNDAYLRSHWYLIVGMCVATLADNAFRLFEGRYTVRVAAVTTIAHITTAALACILFLNSAVMNQPQLSQFLEQTAAFDPDSREVLTVLFGDLGFWIAVSMVIGAVIEIAVSIFKAVKYSVKTK